MLAQHSGSLRSGGSTEEAAPSDARGPNIVDALRLPAALCVVWYHNPLYWSLGSATAAVDGGKFLLLGWSMPFFYAASVYFAIRQKPVALTSRIVRLLLLIAVFTVLYSIAERGNSLGLVATCVVRAAGACDARYIFETFRSVGGTPLYYLSDLVVVVAAALLLSVVDLKVRCGLFAGAGIVFWAVGEPRMLGLFLNPLAAGAVVVGAVAAAFPRQTLKATMPGVPILGGLATYALAWGAMNYALIHDAYSLMPVWLALPMGVALSGLLVANDLVVPNGRMVSLLSALGRRYAFGVFAFHQLAYDLLPTYARAGSLLAFLAEGLAATAVSLAVTEICCRVFPSVLRA